MESSTKKILIFAFGFVLLVGSVSYYLLFALPEKNEKQAALWNQEKCQEAGIKTHNLYTKEIEKRNRDAEKQTQKPEGYLTATFISPEFVYNAGLQKCLYYGGSRVFAHGASLFGEQLNNESFIKDVYTNQILHTWSQIQKTTIRGSEEELKKAYTELFSVEP